jgi:2-methylcitrate dehydratase PrpD
MDFDDSIAGENPIHHPTASTFPAALAVAERTGGVSGKDFVAAVALGNDLSIRLASCPEGNMMADSPFFPVSVFGVFSAAAASGKLLKLSEAEMLNTLGLALHRAGGANNAVCAPDSDVRAIRDGFTNEAGVISALMASKGIAACKDAIEQLYKVYFNSRYNPEPLTLDLSKKFRGAEVEYKIWPSCGQTHNYIQAALNISKEHNVKPDEIEEVILTGSKDAVQHCLPPEAAKPLTSIAAKFSISFCVAVALVKQRVSINDFMPESLKDPAVLRIAEKTRFMVDPTFGPFNRVIIEVRTKKGQSYSYDLKRTNHEKTKSSVEEIIAKFKDCAGYSRKPLSAVSIEKLITTILNLEKVNDIREITRILA